MKKILWLLVMAYRNYIAYIPDIIWVNIIFVIRIIVIVTLYKFLYWNYSTNSLISWYTLAQITYAVIIAQMISTAKPRIVDEISHDVKTWKIWIYFLNPINYILFKFLEFFPIFMQNVVFWLIFGLIIGFIMVWIIPLTIPWFFAWILLLFWSMLISFFSYLFIWLLSFYTEDVEAFRFIYSKFDMILWWNILPIPFLPWIIKTIAYLSPFPYFWYTSWLVFTSFNLQTFLQYFWIQMFWLIITLSSCILIFNKAKMKLTINWG